MLKKLIHLISRIRGKLLATLILVFSCTGLIAQHLNYKEIISNHHYDTNKFAFYNNLKSNIRFKKVLGKVAVPDSARHDMYGDLLNDDTIYNKKYPWYVPATRVIETDVFIWALDRVLFNADFSYIGIETSRHNLRSGFEWDDDRFGINFVGHPYSGGLFYVNARANGYGFLESVPFAIGGSLLWEYFGENTRPSYNDIINTPITGVFLGEILYRISSNILDDRATGFNRTMREIAVGFLTPTREFNRLIQGKHKRVVKKEIYEKGPLNVYLYGGVQKRNTLPNSVYGAGPTNPIFNVQLDYGNPFEVRGRKPFDFFKFRVDFSFETGRKILDNVVGYGYLFGKNKKWGKIDVLGGIYQNYDYWDNKSFEIGTLGFGPGIITKYIFNKNKELYTNALVAVVPLAGISNVGVEVNDTIEVRDYNYGGGLEGKFETTYNFGTSVSLGFSAYYYLIHTYFGLKEDNFVGILKPKVSFRIFKNASLGFEHTIFYNNNNIKLFPDIHNAKTEQKIFLSFFFEDPRRSGNYH